MKKISCDIIRDMLPLYLDDVVSDATKEMVEEHLQSCTSCRAEAAALKKDVILPASKSQRFADARVIKKIKNKIFRKKVIISLITVAAVLAVGAGVYTLLVLPKSIIPYEESGVSVSSVSIGDSGNSQIYCNIAAVEAAGSVSHDPVTVQTEDGKKTVVILYAYSTPWSKYIQPHLEDEAEMSMTFEPLGGGEEIDEVYYGEFEPAEQFYENPSAVLEKAELIWSAEEQE